MHVVVTHVHVIVCLASVVGVHLVYQSSLVVPGTCRCQKEPHQSDATIHDWHCRVRIRPSSLRWHLLLQRSLGLSEHWRNGKRHGLEGMVYYSYLEQTQFVCIRAAYSRRNFNCLRCLTYCIDTLFVIGAYDNMGFILG